MYIVENPIQKLQSDTFHPRLQAYFKGQPAIEPGESPGCRALIPKKAGRRASELSQLERARNR